MSAAVADTPGNRRRAWGNVAVLVLAQAILGAQLAMVFITAGLAGAMIAPNPCFATLPVSMVMLGSAVCGQISTEELSYAANLIQSRNFRAFESFIVATLIYLALSVALRRLLDWAGPKYFFGR